MVAERVAADSAGAAKEAGKAVATAVVMAVVMAVPCAAVHNRCSLCQACTAVPCHKARSVSRARRPGRRDYWSGSRRNIRMCRSTTWAVVWAAALVVAMAAAVTVEAMEVVVMEAERVAAAMEAAGVAELMVVAMEAEREAAAMVAVRAEGMVAEVMGAVEKAAAREVETVVVDTVEDTAEGAMVGGWAAEVTVAVTAEAATVVVMAAATAVEAMVVVVMVVTTVVVAMEVVMAAAVRVGTCIEPRSRHNRCRLRTVPGHYTCLSASLDRRPDRRHR